MNNILEYNGYMGSVEFSGDDECFFGKIIGINDLVTFEGDNVRKIKDAFIEAVDDYLAMCEETGKEPEKAYRGTFNVRIDPLLHKRAAILATASNTSLNQFVETAIAEKVQMISHH